MRYNKANHTDDEVSLRQDDGVAIRGLVHSAYRDAAPRPHVWQAIKDTVTQPAPRHAEYRKWWSQPAAWQRMSVRLVPAIHAGVACSLLLLFMSYGGIASQSGTNRVTPQTGTSAMLVEFEAGDTRGMLGAYPAHLAERRSQHYGSQREQMLAPAGNPVDEHRRQWLSSIRQERLSNQPTELFQTDIVR